MTHSHVTCLIHTCHASFTCVTWLILSPACTLPRWPPRHGSFVCDMPFHSCHASLTCVTWLIIVPLCILTRWQQWHFTSTCDMTHSHVPRLIHMCDMTHPITYVYPNALATESCLIHMCDMTHSHVPCLIHTCDMTHPITCVYPNALATVRGGWLRRRSCQFAFAPWFYPKKNSRQFVREKKKRTCKSHAHTKNSERRCTSSSQLPLEIGTLILCVIHSRTHEKN